MNKVVSLHNFVINKYIYMNTTMITAGKANALNKHLNVLDVNRELLTLTQELYKEPLTTKQIGKICAMSYLDKLWLIAQYKQEIEMTSSPDLSNLY